MGEFCVVEADVIIESGVVLGHHVVIHAGTIIGADVRIGDGCILGCAPTLAATSTTTKKDLEVLTIGENCVLSNKAIIYKGVRMGKSSFVGDYASVREGCILSDFVLVGRGVTVENDVVIGEYTKIQTGAYITAYSRLADHVFIAPMVTTTNDNYMGRTERRFANRKGPSFERGCRVGGGAHILPGVTIGEEAFVATGSVVTRDVPPYRLVMGAPARVTRDVPKEEWIFQPTNE
jgi:acetyltransferase-like isoleucine patch superfamily enzyme